MTPYEIVRDQAEAQAASKRQLLKIVRLLEVAALAEPPPEGYGVLQDGRLLTPTTSRIWSRLAEAGTTSVLLARELPVSAAPGVVGVPLADDDPLADEWVVLFTGPTGMVLAAADLPYERWDADRTFTYGISRSPEVVEACRSALLSRVAGVRTA